MCVHKATHTVVIVFVVFVLRLQRHVVVVLFEFAIMYLCVYGKKSIDPWTHWRVQQMTRESIAANLNLDEMWAVLETYREGR